MEKENFWDNFNISKQCKKYGLPLWKCPQFLFAIMGIVIALAILISYFVGMKYLAEPFLVLILVFLETGVLLIIAFGVVKSFENLTQANQLKSDFIDLISHQLKSPLTAIRWGLDELKETNPEKKGEIENLEDNTVKMLNMIEKFLLASKIEQTGINSRKKEFSLEELTVALLNTTFRKEAHLVRVKSDRNLPKVKSDPEQIEVVTENLLSNALKYSNREVDVRIKRDGKMIKLEVEDRGIGVPEKEQKSIFDKFYRSSNALNIKEKGSGLGLYLSREIIKNLGGKIGFTSKKDRGSIFWFKIPAK